MLRPEIMTGELAARVRVERGRNERVYKIYVLLLASKKSAGIPRHTPSKANTHSPPQAVDVTPVSRFQAVANTAPGRAALGPIA